MALSRRRFLQHGLTVVAAGVALPPWLQGFAQAATPGDVGSAPDDSRVLVVLQFSGGNDGLNTVIPYADTNYLANRPQIGVPANAVLHLDNNIGLHPNLTGLKGLYDKGRVAVLQGVGYPNPNRSHFRSMEIWHTAAPETMERYGWIGKYLDANPALSANSLAAINLGVEAPKAIIAQKASVLTVNNLNTFGVMSAYGYRSKAENPVELMREMEQDCNERGAPSERLVQAATMDAFQSADRIRESIKKYHSTVVYPQRNPLASGFQEVAKLLAAGLGTRVFYVSTGGFDTHAREKAQHDILMQNVGDALAAFFQDLDQMGMADRVTVITFSEFGRRVQENAGGGTDHGTAGPMFVVGGKVKGGVYGAPPSLTDLDHGDLKFETDFRSVYATMLDQWLSADSGRVLGQQFPHVPSLLTV
ncbi:MAG TPA: DUF1501 domain-containing protein [Armatimonadota bacterium]|nr:DUF1501 domain-containing protein [Armatimonadota bacterium]